MFAMVIIGIISVAVVVTITILGVRHPEHHVTVDSASVVAMLSAADAVEKRERDMQPTVKMAKSAGDGNDAEDDAKKARREAALARKVARGT